MFVAVFVVHENLYLKRVSWILFHVFLSLVGMCVIHEIIYFKKSFLHTLESIPIVGGHRLFYSDLYVHPIPGMWKQ